MLWIERVFAIDTRSMNTVSPTKNDLVCLRLPQASYRNVPLRIDAQPPWIRNVLDEIAVKTPLTPP